MTRNNVVSDSVRRISTSDTDDWWRGVVAFLRTAGVTLAGSGVATEAKQTGLASFADDSLTVTRRGVLAVPFSLPLPFAAAERASAVARGAVTASPTQILNRPRP